jgi:hypothetical protein
MTKECEGPAECVVESEVSSDVFDPCSWLTDAGGSPAGSSCVGCSTLHVSAFRRAYCRPHVHTQAILASS